MSKITIWGRNNSNNVRKALWAAHELGLTFDNPIVGGPYGGTRTTEYLALNPMAQIPTLQDGEVVVCESNAIVRYLFGQYAPPSTWKTQATPASRSVGDRWMDWTSTSLAHPFRRVFWPLVREKDKPKDWEKIAADTAKVEELLRVPEAWLATHDWFSGDEFGAGDIPIGSFLYAWFEMDVKGTEKTPNLEKWYARLKERPAYQKGVMTELT